MTAIGIIHHFSSQIADYIQILQKIECFTLLELKHHIAPTLHVRANIFLVVRIESRISCRSIVPNQNVRHQS